MDSRLVVTQVLDGSSPSPHLKETMSYQYNICKGKACALHLTPEFLESSNAPPRSQNPYDFWDKYTKHYAWDIGNQMEHC